MLRTLKATTSNFPGYQLLAFSHQPLALPSAEKSAEGIFFWGGCQKVVKASSDQ